MEQEKYNSLQNDKHNNQPPSFAKKASDAASEIVQNGRDSAASASDELKKAGSAVACKTNSVLSSVGSSMNSIAGAIHDNAPSEGMVNSAAESVAGTLKSGGDYLTKHGIEDMGKDLTGIIKRHPITSIWIGLGLGVLLGSAVSRR